MEKYKLARTNKLILGISKLLYTHACLDLETYHILYFIEMKRR